MTASSITAAGRRFTESLMVDSCVIGPRVRSEELDEESGEYIYSIDPVYTGPCKVRIAAVQVRDVDSQGQDLAVADGILSIPVDAPGSAEVEKNHIAAITITANDTVLIEAVIQAGHAQTYATARRFPIEITT